MGNYENLKQSITEVIRTNGNQEITGAVLQSTLLTIISTVGANATFAGIATPTTNPGTPDGPVFYLASESGTYSNFGSIELQDGLFVLMWNGSWSGQQIFDVDDEPTAGSDNLVKSGGVQEELALGTVYDVSAKNPTGGSNNDGKWESLSALLSDANLNTLIPTAVRKGGMSIKFIQSSDNKYVQWRLMNNDWSTTVSDWQGVDDEPSAGSNNLVKSGGVYTKIKAIEDAGYVFAGVATPSTNPSTPNQKVFYIASEAGTYTNFSAIELQDGLSILMWNGSWSSQQIFSVDNVPTAGSDNLVKSGGVHQINSQLSDRITDEVDRATAAETQLDDRITDEVDRATAAETQLDDRITNENSRALIEETRIEGRLNSNRFGYNVTVFGLVTGVHTLATAVKNVPLTERFGGQKITFKTDLGWVTYQNTSLDISDYENVTNWVLDSGVSELGDVTITNNPDYEDLTQNEGGQLKFADKTYNAATYTGLGRKYLRKNIAGGVNILTQDMLVDANTIYHIQYDYTLGENITIPENCILEFDGGSISGEHTITGQNTGIEAGLVKIFSTDVTLAGSWNVAEAYPEWFGAKGDGTTDDFTALNACLYSMLSSKIVLSKIYAISNGLYFTKVEEGNVYDKVLNIVGVNNEKSGLFLFDSSVNKPVIHIFGNGVSVSNINIRGAKNCTEWSEHSTFSNCDGIKLQDCQKETFVDKCIVYNLRNNGISTIGCKKATHITNNLVSNVFYEHILTANYSENDVISGNVVGSFSDDVRAYFGIDSNYKNTIITSNIIKNCKIGITYEDMSAEDIDEDTSSRSYNALITNNIIVGTTTAAINSSSASAVRKVVVSNNCIYKDINEVPVDSDMIGISFTNVKNGIIKGNLIQLGNTTNNIQDRSIGIYLKKSCENISIDSNIIQDCKRFGISLHDQDYTEELYNENIDITNNIIENSSAAGIQVRTKNKKVSITTNTFRGSFGISVINEPEDWFNVENNNQTDITKDLLVFPTQNDKTNKEMPSVIKTYGTSLERPTKGLYYGFKYYDTTLLKIIFWNGSNWIDSDGIKASVQNSGTFANKPLNADINIGFSYFCTDKNTTEGSTDGIMIYHKGNDVWVDALGRVVS